MPMNNLISLIESKGVRRAFLARHLNLTETAFRNKLNGKTEFKASEMIKLRDFFELDQNEFLTIFFS